MRVDFYAVCFFCSFVRSVSVSRQTVGPNSTKLGMQVQPGPGCCASPFELAPPTTARLAGSKVTSCLTPSHFKAELLENYKRKLNLFVIDIDRGVFGEFNGVTSLPLAPTPGVRGHVKVEKWHFFIKIASKVLKTKKQPHNMVTGIQTMIRGEFNRVTRLTHAPAPGARGRVKVEK